MTTVDVRNVSKDYGSIPAVIDVSFSVREQEFISLLGPSGCGKTTLLRMIAGFERPTKGSIHLMGQPIDDVPPYRRSTNLIFQHLALFPHLNVFDNVAFALRMKRLNRAAIRPKVERMLELVHLGGFGGRDVRELSGGQRQRVAIARALVNEPAVLLLDEPLAALDVHLRAQMQLELKEIQHRVGTTFVFVTHDQTEALTMSDRIAVIHAGRLEQIGAARSVYDAPRTRFVAGFLGASNILPGYVLASGPACTTLRIADRLLHAQANPVVKVGDVAYLSVRPERIRTWVSYPREQREPMQNECDGVLKEVTFKGPLIEYTVQTPIGVLQTLAQSSGSTAPRQGEAVGCGWCIGDSVVLCE
jgi:spermidine/putrescine transport system ATP-binding protein